MKGQVDLLSRERTDLNVIAEHRGVKTSGLTALSDRRRLFQVGVVLLLFLCAYAPTIGCLAEIWRTRDDYTHGFLIVPISLYMLWVKRHRFQEIPIAPAPLPGLCAVLFSGMLLLLGNAGDIITVAGLSLVMMVIALVILLLGWEHLKGSIFPISYLLFMIPILDAVVAPLRWPFQLMTARMGVGMMQSLGLTAAVEQQYIILPNITLEVAQVCSGASYLVSIMAIGLPLAYLVLRSWWSRLVLILTGVAIGVAANWLRVFLIGIWAYQGGEIHGPYHIFQGMFAAWIGFGALFIGTWVLSKMDHGRRGLPMQTVFPEPVSIRASFPKRQWDRSWRLAFFFLLLLAVPLLILKEKPVDLMSDPDSFPFRIGGLPGSAPDLQSAPFRIEGADVELFRTYWHPEGQPIQLYIAYMKSQHQGKEIINYKTAPLHRHAEEVPLQINPDRSILINVGRLDNGPARQRVLFWYDINGHIFANPYRAKLFETVEALLWHRSNGALVLISADPPRVEPRGIRTEEETFIRALAPLLRWYLP